MKKYILSLVIPLLCCQAFAQVNISTGAQWVNNGNVTIVLNNMDLVNNGTLSAGNSSMKLTGNQNSTIAGSNTVHFDILEVAKNSNAKIILGRDIGIGSSVNFISGLLDLNNNNIILNPSAYVAGEAETSRIIGANGGYVEITKDLNAPFSSNPGFLGAVISSSANLGSVTLRRGNTVQSGTGLPSGINHYFIIQPTNNSSLNATLRFNYFDAEKNGKDETNFVLFQSDDNGASWTNQSQTDRSAVSNYVEKTGLNSLSRFTLSDLIDPGCSATGVVLSVKDSKQSTVTVSWTTATETNNQGFVIERRLKNEASFTQIGLVNSKAVGGNSASPLSYSYVDNNSYADTSFYRLKIVSLNNSTCYSDIKFLVPKGKKGPGHNLITATDVTEPAIANKTVTDEKSSLMKLDVGPNPNNGTFWFTVTGIEKETMATLYSIDGKAMKQFRVTNLQQQQVSNLKSGVYILKVEGLQPFRIVVQGIGSSINNNPAINSSSIKN